MRDSDVRDADALELASFDFQPVGAFLGRQDAVGMRWRGGDRGGRRRLADHGVDLDGQGNKKGPAVDCVGLLTVERFPFLPVPSGGGGLGRCCDLLVSFY
jgi:hypothetical protein